MFRGTQRPSGGRNFVFTTNEQLLVITTLKFLRLEFNENSGTIGNKRD